MYSQNILRQLQAVTNQKLVWNEAVFFAFKLYLCLQIQHKSTLKQYKISHAQVKSTDRGRLLFYSVSIVCLTPLQIHTKILNNL